MSRRKSRPYLTDARRAFGWLPNALGIFPENVTLRFFSAGCVGVRFVCDVQHASFCGLYYRYPEEDGERLSSMSKGYLQVLTTK